MEMDNTDMKSYLIVYRLGFPEVSYPKLIAYLKTAPQWARPFDCAWLIKTTTGVAEIRGGIRDRMNRNDRVLVIEVTSNNWATFLISKEVTDWMKNNL